MFSTSGYGLNMTMSHNFTYYVSLNDLVWVILQSSYHTHITHLWYNIIQLVYINTTRGTIFTNIWSQIFILYHLLFSKFYGCKVYFTTFWYNLKYISYIVKIGGGGLCGENIPIY